MRLNDTSHTWLGRQNRLGSVAKKDRQPDAIAVLAATVNALIDRAGTQKKAGKVAQTTLSRLAGNKSRSNPRLSTLQRLADSHKLQVWQLLVPGFDPRYPPKLAGQDGDTGHNFKPHEVDLIISMREVTPRVRAIITAMVAADLEESSKSARKPIEESV